MTTSSGAQAADAEAPAAPQPQAKSSTRRLDLDRLKGLGILLVVFGHLMRGGEPGYDQYTVLRTAVYDFHMPLFFYLSGYVFFLAGYQNTSDYKRFALRRTYRLLLPFVIFGVVSVLGKFLLQSYIHIDKAPNSLWFGLSAIFLNSPGNPVVSIWYIWVLLLLSLATPLLWRLFGPRLLLAALPLIVVAAVVSAPREFYLDRLVRNAGFFLLGGVAQYLEPRWLTWLRRLAPLSLLLFAAALVLAAPLDFRIRLAVCGLLSILALHGLILLVPWGKERVLVWLGENLFGIYLLNTICIGLVKGVALKLVPGLYDQEWLLLSLLLVAGLIGPILIRELLFRPFKPLYDLTR
jgi:fucose 4-O-acetylase-like acetyltransferase